MKYIIVSPRVGTPGEPYEPEVMINLGSLLAGGFIKPADDATEETTEETAPAPTKSAKNKSSKAPTEE